MPSIVQQSRASVVALMSRLLTLACLPCAAAAAELSQSLRVQQAVQPVLDEMALKYNMTFTFGYVDHSGRAAAAAGYDNIFRKLGCFPGIEDHVHLL